MEQTKTMIRMTAPRRKIYELFCNHPERHLTADQVYSILKDQGEPIGLATVYRVLAQFTESGILTRHMFNQQAAVYEIEDHRHDHLVCVVCGEIIEFVCTELLNIQKELARNHNYAIADHKLVFYGACAKCEDNEA